jgi:nucleotide-binding universal stress UspA family protein
VSFRFDDGEHHTNVRHLHLCQPSEPETTLAEVPQQQIPRQEATLSFKNILLATDFSDASEKAFNYAIPIARLHGSKIYLVHVLRPDFSSVMPEPPSDWVRHEAEREMEALASRSELKPIAYETVVRMGSVWSVLSAVIGQENIDLIVLERTGVEGSRSLYWDRWPKRLCAR